MRNRDLRLSSCLPVWLGARRSASGGAPRYVFQPLCVLGDRFSLAWCHVALCLCSGRIEVAPPNSDSNPQTQPVEASYELLTAYSPGMQPERFDIDHSAQLVPAGSDLVLQVHCLANGKGEVHDQTKIALELAKMPPERRFMSAVVNSANWTIAPGDPNAEGHARLTFGEPVELVFVQPHMHLRKRYHCARAFPRPNIGASAERAALRFLVADRLLIGQTSDSA